MTVLLFIFYLGGVLGALVAFDALNWHGYFKAVGIILALVWPLYIMAFVVNYYLENEVKSIREKFSKHKDSK